MPPNHERTDEGAAILNGAETVLSVVIVNEPAAPSSKAQAATHDAAVPVVMIFPLRS